VAYSAAVRLSSVLEVVLLLEEEDLASYMLNFKPRLQTCLFRHRASLIYRYRREILPRSNLLRSDFETKQYNYLKSKMHIRQSTND